jgi:hypothetical protein
MAMDEAPGDGTARGRDTGWHWERLLPVELLTLQLAAQGYSFAQIARLRRVLAVDVADTLRGACLALGVTTLTDAIAEARRRGLIR